MVEVAVAAVQGTRLALVGPQVRVGEVGGCGFMCDY